MIKKKCYSVSSYFQFKELIKLKKNKRRILVIFIKNYLVEGFGVNWLFNFLNLIKKNYKEYNLKFYIDSGTDYGLSSLIIHENIDYLKLKSNKVVLKKISQLAKKNKVLLNPNFHIVDFEQIKNYKDIKL